MRFRSALSSALLLIAGFGMDATPADPGLLDELRRRGLDPDLVADAARRHGVKFEDAAQRAIHDYDERLPGIQRRFEALAQRGVSPEAISRFAVVEGLRFEDVADEAIRLVDAQAAEAAEAAEVRAAEELLPHVQRIRAMLATPAARLAARQSPAVLRARGQIQAAVERVEERAARPAPTIVEVAQRGRDVAHASERLAEAGGRFRQAATAATAAMRPPLPPRDRAAQREARRARASRKGRRGFA